MFPLVYLQHSSPDLHFKASQTLFSNVFIFYVSYPYSTVVHVELFINFFFNFRLRFLVSNHFFLANVTLPITILILTSLLPSSFHDSLHCQCLNCSISSSAVFPFTMFNLRPSLLALLITFGLPWLILIPYFSVALLTLFTV